MDITPIYDLRARLRAAMIAGTNLLAEDFRLKRAVEAIVPLEQASPVFARIGQLSRALLDPAQTDREGALLDAITLVDAVLCTQGIVSAGAGAGEENEIKKLPGNAWGNVVTNAPYSVVSTLVEALTSSGSGHFSYVTETHEAHSELFSDYRIKAAMVQALGASYSELAELVESWLRDEDSSLLPLLQNGFDPEGKKEMVRRVRVMEAIAPKEANEFFIEKLQEAKKEVRQALIFALRHCPENEELLWELTKSEKGNSKQAAYQALAHMESEQAEKYFTDLYAKKPEEVMQNLKYTKSVWAAKFVAVKLEEQVQPFEDRKDYFLTDEQALVLQATLAAIAGKTGPEMIQALRKTIRLGDRLEYPFEDRKKRWEFFSPVVNSGNYQLNGRYSKNVSFLTILVNTLHRTLLRTADPELCRFVMEMYEENKKSKENSELFFAIAAFGHLLVDEDCSEWLAKELFTSKPFFINRQLSKLYTSLYWAFRSIAWNESRQAFIYEDVETNFGLLDGYQVRYVHILEQDMTGRIAEILMKCRDTKLDTLLVKYVSRSNEGYRAKLEEYYYKRALEVSDNRFYAQSLKNFGCARCDGLAVQYFKNNNNQALPLWSIKLYVNSYLPGDSQAKYEEMQKVYELVKSRKIKLQNSATAEQELLAYIEELKV